MRIQHARIGTDVDKIVSTDARIWAGKRELAVIHEFEHIPAGVRRRLFDAIDSAINALQLLLPDSGGR